MQCTSVTYLIPGQRNGFIMCAQSFENIDAIENRGSTKCYNFNVLENWQREGYTKDDRSTACESFYFIFILIFCDESASHVKNKQTKTTINI